MLVFFIFILVVIFIGCIFLLIKRLALENIFLVKQKKIDYLIIGIIITSSIILIVSLLSVDYLLENPNIDEDGKIEYIGTIGDIVGGLINPAIAIPATLLTFLAFWVQYKANDEVRKQFDIQKFESEFNIKITIFRNEITELRLPTNNQRNYEGREVMYQLDKELKFIYFIVKNSLFTTDYQKVLIISYFIFFKGRLLFYKNIENLSKKYLIDKKELEAIEVILSSLYSYFKVNINEFEINQINDINNDENDIRLERVRLLKSTLRRGYKIIEVNDEFDNFQVVYDLFSDIYSFNIYHTPFKGHETRLSLLFRQIFTIIKFVNQEKNLSYEQKRSYLRTLRSLLSNYDQLHIFYNWYSKTAEKWESKENKFLTDLRIIHNIPTDLIINDFNLEDIFSDLNFRFEKGKRNSDSLFEHIEIYSIMEVD